MHFLQPNDDMIFIVVLLNQQSTFVKYKKILSVVIKTQPQKYKLVL